jgi:hypothetical protein
MKSYEVAVRIASEHNIAGRSKVRPLALCQEANTQPKSRANAASIQQTFVNLENEWAKADNGKDTKVLETY